MPKFAMAAQVISLFLLALLIGICATTQDLLSAVLAILAAASFVVSCGAWVNKNCYAMCVDFFYIIISGIIMIAAQALL